jgi:single-stranded-DNA-specific exonuclease
MRKKWEILYPQLLTADKSKKEILKILFDNRDLVWSNRKDFFNPPNPKSISPDKVGLDQSTLKQAKELIEAQADQGKIIIFGDYDVDGLTATALLWRALRKQGYDVLPYIPDREKDGYGLKEKSVKKLIDEYKDLSLIITVDNGIVAHQAVDFAKDQGVKVIVTDHHIAHEDKPKADLVLHTTEIGGCGVAWFLAQQFGYHNLSLVAIGTIADMLPLTGANRSFVKYGLKELEKPKEVGLQELKKTAGVDKGELLPWQISFVLAPRLNAAGRLNKPLTALRLLCTNNRDQAKKLAWKLNQINQQRQQLTETGLNLAKQEDWADKKLLITAHADYHQGIIGLIAGRLTDEFSRPSIAIWQGKEMSKGSARSVSGCNIVELIEQTQDLLEGFGGHEKAAGFSVKTENLEDLIAKLNQIAEQEIDRDLLEHQLRVDFEIDFSLIKKNFYQQIKKLGPYGIGNPKPTFALKNSRIVDIQAIGGNNQHLKMFLDDPETPLVERIEAEAIGFGWGDWVNKVMPGDLVDIIFSFNLNQWNGKETLQLKIKDLRKAK